MNATHNSTVQEGQKGRRGSLWLRPVLFVVALANIVLHASVSAQSRQDSGIIRLNEADVLVQYHPRAWAGYYYANCGNSPPGPDSIVSYPVTFLGELPGSGYPHHRSLIAGLNDTLQAIVEINNRRYKAFPLVGTKYEQWYAPCVYTLDKAPGFPPLRDSTELGFRIRTWKERERLTVAPDTIPPQNNRYAFVIDIWNLPEGFNQICLLPTASVPGDIRVMAGGYVFRYYPPQSLADTINAYEGCYWRLYFDGDFEGANVWVDTILSVNPFSVPGWWLKASNALELHDTVTAIAAYDSAMFFFSTGADPAMPDSTKQPLTGTERGYLEHVQIMLEYNRKLLEP